MTTPETRLCAHHLTGMSYRDVDLVEDLIGKKTFTEVMIMQILGREARPVDMRIVDAVLVTLMEHGLTPSAIATRLIYMSAPENLQGAVASGLMAVGSQFVGTMENCSRLLDRIRQAADGRAEALAIAREFRDSRQALPGFGHHLHKPDDPRSIKLLALAEAEPDLPGDSLKALRLLAAAIDETYGKHITINATGAVAALLSEIGVPTALMRGFAVISRAAGLVSHVAEEQQSPSGRFIWETIDHAIPYVGKGKSHQRNGEPSRSRPRPAHGWRARSRWWPAPVPRPPAGASARPVA
ncbi:citryl-CoA lyase [Achromobacter ruhlandii]|nr:citryl-CoA lyase [Achromobacter ruhlandii]MCZ8396881.1 citryl-CoA lyase [Achromobacter ruhlandii]